MSGDPQQVRIDRIDYFYYYPLWHRRSLKYHYFYVQDVVTQIRIGPYIAMYVARNSDSTLKVTRVITILNIQNMLENNYSLETLQL
jgi:hypothetical protein